MANPQLINTHNNSTPIASKEETKIKHWRQPEIKREFWDIPLLPNAFIDVNPAANLDNIPVGTLGTDGGNKTDIMTLAKEIDQGDHGKFDSLLITYKGKLLFESYYLRGRIDLSHPQSSVTKVYTGLALGRAIKLGYLNLADLNKPVASFLEDLEPKKFVYGADEITLHQALTMTSGLRINEESRKVMKNNPQLVKGQKEIQFLFENSNPIIPESKVFYYDIGPQLIMQVLEAVIPGTVKIFIEKEVFGPLGITNFDWKTAPSGSPESIWKSSLTSRDMIKIGLLVSNKGKWQGNQLIDESFITKSINKLIITGDDEIFGDGKDVSNQGYGYYWWSSDLKSENKTYKSVSAQGGGGMYIIIVDELDLVIAITAHHAEHVTQQLVAERILPAFIK